MVARLVRDEKVGGSNPLTPTFREIKPFDEHVEGLSHCGEMTCAVEAAVRTDGVEDAPPRADPEFLTLVGRPWRRGRLPTGGR